jgi:4a-hydroxytetrahydrobiopterin dehydratase
MGQLLSDAEIDAALKQLHTDWSRDGDTIRRSVEAPSFLDGISLVQAVAQAAEDRNHHPDIDIRWTTVTFALSTHSDGGLTPKDFDLAGAIDSLAGRAG